MLDIIRSRSQSFFIKLIFGAIIVVFLLWGVGNFTGGASSGNVAEVNGEAIAVREYWPLLQRYVESERMRDPQAFSTPEQLTEVKRQILRELISITLWRQQAERLGLFISPYELRAAMAQYGAFQDAAGKFSVERYTNFLEAQKIF